jgi:hypothetical protein
MPYQFTQRLFTKYSDLDDKVIKIASNLDFYLIGGTALEIWMNQYHLKFNRDRSNNDLDFTCSPLTEIKNINSLRSELKQLGIKSQVDSIGYYRFDHNLIQVDILTDDANLIDKYGCILNNIKIMDPIYLYLTKYRRSIKLDKNSNRRKKDDLDLKDLVQVIKLRGDYNKLHAELN